MNVGRVEALRAFSVGLGDFSPGIDAARAQGVKITRDAYALGDAGTLGQSIPMVLQKIREGRLDPAVRGWAGDILHAAGDPQGIRVKSQAILDEFRSATVYAPDPAGAEFIASAAATLCLRPGLCIRARDCDDGVVAVGSAMSSINIPVWVVFQDFGIGKQQHVLLASQDETGNKFYIDPSTKWPVGSSASAQREEWFDPLDGLAGPEIIGVGWSPVSEEYLEMRFAGVAGVTSENPGNDNATERHLVKRADGAWWEYAGGGWHRESGLGWVPADWSSMKPVIHEVGLGPLCPSGGCKNTLLRQTGLDPQVSLAAAPVPSATEYIETDAASIKTGARYYFAIKTDLSPGDLQAVLTDDWNPIEEFSQDLPGFFRIRAIAAHDAPLKANGDVSGLFGFSKGTIAFLSILVEVASGTTVPLIPAIGSSTPDNTPIAITTSSTSTSGLSGTGVILTAMGITALGGYLWGVHKRHKRLFGRRH